MLGGEEQPAGEWPSIINGKDCACRLQKNDDDEINVRDAVSAMVLRIPAMDHDTKGDALLTMSRVASARVNCAATMDFDELSLFVQLTVQLVAA